jgi:glycosyltransferase involved in cell wall biosynthesis
VARVVLICNDVIGERMAGPAIRYWELAGQLSDGHDVTLVTRDPAGVTSDRFRTVALVDRTLGQVLADADVCVTQLVWPSVAAAVRRHGVRIVLDCYDPMLLEELEAFSGAHERSQVARNRRTLAKTRMSLASADAVVCANERQRDLWLGALMALGRLTPQEYAGDASLRKLVSLVPFGLPDEPPTRTGPGIRSTLGLTPDASLLLWGGGLWNWFDPLTLIRAVHLLAPTHPNLHLAFLGVRHPNEHVPKAEMAGRAVALAEELGLLGRSVHVNYGWVPYDERQNHLLDADIGVSTHFDQLETRFAFRTRMLDYLWAGLPIVATQGDSFAELVEREQLGAVVPPEDPVALASALGALLDDAPRRASTAQRVQEVAPRFRWSEVAASLDSTIHAVLERREDRRLPLAPLARYAAASVQELVVERRSRELAARVTKSLRDRARR